jgi:hypothetical protein
MDTLLGLRRDILQKQKMRLKKNQLQRKQKQTMTQQGKML